MASIVTTQTDYTADGLAHVWTLFDDGTITITDAKGATITVGPSDSTAAVAAAFKASANDAANRATIEQALAGALPALASIDDQLRALSTLTLSGTTAQQLAQVQAALRGLGTNLRPLVAGVRRSVRLLSDQLDSTT